MSWSGPPLAGIPIPQLAERERTPPPSPGHKNRFRTDIKEKRQKKWDEDPDSLLKTQYNQFCNVIMMATFTGGIQIAILAFMNEFKSKEDPSHTVVPGNLWQRRYTVESFGMMIGYLAVGLSMGCAGVAAVNASLTCYFSVYPPITPPAMEGHVLLCMLLLFGSFALSGLSSTLLSTNFDIPFTVAVTVMLSGAVVLTGYQIVLQVLAKSISPFTKPWHLTTVVLAAGILTVDLLEPTSSSWYTMLVCGCTLGAYVVAILFVKGDQNSAHPFYMSAWLHASGATIMILLWAGCAALKVTWGLWDGVSQVKPYILASLSGVEAALFVVITAFYWRGIDTRRRSVAKHSTQDDHEAQIETPERIPLMPVPELAGLQTERSLSGSGSGLDSVSMASSRSGAAV